ncbi:hypothetical protein L915_15895 [Phytophthora nicotianae]|uniref:Uncharacterized protein n=1 Tax=Phytophthora nicotianae TaxID=4792 RepID=W2G4N1_PHYNI|nr:hypothetical protein L915_15895 [Phytophthora nicotianae]
MLHSVSELEGDWEEILKRRSKNGTASVSRRMRRRATREYAGRTSS